MEKIYIIEKEGKQCTITKDEIFKTFVKLPEHYGNKKMLIDKYGNMYSITRDCIIKKYIHHSRYCYKFNINGKYSSKSIDKLLAETFIPRTENQTCLGFKDGNTLNYNLDNLYWYDPLDKLHNIDCNGEIKQITTREILDTFTKFTVYDREYMTDIYGNVYSIKLNKFKTKEFNNKEGKYFYRFYKNRLKNLRVDVDKLIAEIFIPRLPHQDKILHKNGNILDNDINNLAWYGTSYEFNEILKTTEYNNIPYYCTFKEYPEFPEYYCNYLGMIYSTYTGKILSNRDNGRGYHTVVLYHNGKPYPRKVHRIVAITHIPNPLNLPEVNHKNAIRTDNRVFNLEWCTGEYNTEDAIKRGATKCGSDKDFMESVMIKDENNNVMFFDTIYQASDSLDVEPWLLHYYNKNPEKDNMYNLKVCNIDLINSNPFINNIIKSPFIKSELRSPFIKKYKLRD